MKTTLFTSVLLFMSFGLFAQTSLTYANNSLIAGDSNAFREIQFSDPGNAGSNQVWDFSMVQYTGKSPVSTIQSATVPKADGVGGYNLSLIDNGNDYFMNSMQNLLEEWGYVNKEQKLILKYSDPVVKMRYPFSYGEQFSDHFIGVAWYNETNTIDFFGDCTVAADAYGTLILPDQVIENTLRVKSIKKGLQINMCGTTTVNIVRYLWYAAGYRYPLLSMSIVENCYNQGTPEIIKTAFTNTQQLNERIALSGSNNSVKPDVQAKQVEKPEVLVNLSPNPFSTNLNYNYFLTEQLPVSIELYDLSGKQSGWLVKNQLQAVGLHTGELDALTYGLMPGTYFIRFTFDKQVVIRKVVKI
jgi:hypothetical protein